MYHITFKPRKKTELKKVLGKCLKAYDSKTGIVRRLQEYPLPPDIPDLFLYTGEVCCVANWRPSCSGDSFFERDAAKVAAICEGIERYCQYTYDPTSLIRSTYRDLRDQALDPRGLILISEDEYTQDIDLVRYTDELLLNWIWGFSVTQGRPILVPASFVHLGKEVQGAQPINRPISTGAACGNNVEEAVLGGICEVVERDAFMIAWLNQLAMPRLRLGRENGTRLEAVGRRFRACELDLEIVEITTDVSVPTFAAFILDINRSRKDSFVTVGIAADLSPEEAALKATKEALKIYTFQRIQRDKQPEFQPAEDFSNIVGLNDHLLLYSLPQIVSESAFAWSSTIFKEMAEIPNRATGDILTDLQTLVRLLAERDLEVVIVDITASDVKDLGFRVVKVLIPYMQPLSIRYNLRYLGGYRVYQVPRILGYRQRDAREDEMNPIPHPFA